MSNQEFLNLSYDGLVQCLKHMGEESFRATQIFEWIYQKGVTSFEEMRNLPKGLREELAGRFSIGVRPPGRPPQQQISTDGTTKFLFTLSDGEKIETVLIPTKARNTVCVSSQVGCRFGCKFCASGIGGWKRNLTTAEILAQILHIKNYTLSAKRYPLSVTHIVFMGVGEPLDNYDQVLKSIRIINDKRGLNVGARRITVSTCGVIPKIMELAKEGLQVELSVSLHGFDNESRNALMPVNKKYPFDELVKVCRDYTKQTKRQITFEYILMKDITCTERAVRHLKKAVKGIICKMNLIPYNPVSEFTHQMPSRQEMKSFQEQLQSQGIHSTLRIPRGQDVTAACGQLRHHL